MDITTHTTFIYNLAVALGLNCVRDRPNQEKT